VVHRNVPIGFQAGDYAAVRSLILALRAIMAADGAI
jgi:hypothetical protein